MGGRGAASGAGMSPRDRAESLRQGARVNDSGWERFYLAVEQVPPLEKKMTRNQVTEQYKGQVFDGSRISTVDHYGNYSILLSGRYDPIDAGYQVEGVIDRSRGIEILAGHGLMANSKDDAWDVAAEFTGLDFRTGARSWKASDGSEG